MRRARLDSKVISSRVDGIYYDYAAGYIQTARINDASSLSYVPDGRFDHSSALIDDKWYVLGGVLGGVQHAPSCVEEYDTVHETWHQHSTTGVIPPACTGIACAALDDKLYTLGGCTEEKKYTNTLSELDVGTMAWKTLEPLNPRFAPMLKRDAAMIAHGRTLVTFGGYGTFTESMSQTRAAYEKDGTKVEVWTNELITYDLDKSELQNMT